MSPLDRAADCVILTRFNLPSVGVESMIRAQDGWLRNRIELFERYCVPSVLAQTDRDLNWIIYFDPESPQWLVDRIAPHVAAGAFTPIYRESVSVAELAEDLATTVGAQRRPTLTTIGLDNDDSLATDFVERVRAVDGGSGTHAVYFENGLIRSQGRLYLRRDPTNPFCSVTAPWESLSTCWADWHTLLHNHMPVTVVGGAPAWLQVVHGQNVSNRVRGRLTRASIYHRSFPVVLDDLADPTPKDRGKDLLVARPVRFARESARAGIKGAAMKLLGKDGLDRAKHLLQSARQRASRRSVS